MQFFLTAMIQKARFPSARRRANQSKQDCEEVPQYFCWKNFTYKSQFQMLHSFKKFFQSKKIFFFKNIWGVYPNMVKTKIELEKRVFIRSWRWCTQNFRNLFYFLTKFNKKNYSLSVSHKKLKRSILKFFKISFSKIDFFWFI